LDFTSQLAMKETLVICGYWEDLEASIDSCIERIVLYLSELNRIDPIFSNWFLPSKSAASTLRNKIPINTESVKAVVRKAINEKMGYRITLWNGELDSEKESQVRIRCGIHASVMGVINSCVLRLPMMDISKASQFSMEELQELIVLTVKTWDPGWAIVTSDKLREVVFSKGKPVSRQPYPGYFLYLPKERGEIPTLPHPAQVVPIEGKGNLIVTVNDSFKTAAEYDGWIIDISDILRSKNLLEPMKLNRF